MCHTDVALEMKSFLETMGIKSDHHAFQSLISWVN